MDLSRETFSNHNRTGRGHPPNLPGYFEGLPAHEEFDAHNSSIVAARSSIGETEAALKEVRAKRCRVVDHFLERLWAKDLPGTRHAEWYLRHQYRRNCRPNTISNSYITIECFLSFIKKGGKARIEEVTRWDLEAFIEHEQDRGLKLSTVKTRLGILKAFIRFLVEGGIVHPDVFPWKMRIKPPETLPRAMEPGDEKVLLSVIEDVRDRAMILLLLRTGMRIGELLTTRLSDVNLKEQKILIFESEKNRCGRVVYFSNDARGALKAWLKRRDPSRQSLFYAQGRHTMTYVAARMMFMKYLKKAALSQKEYTLHSLRHTYATELLNAGMRLECLEKLMGHTSLQVTRRYARLTDKTREEEYFRAMAIIERGETDGHYQLDCKLQTVFEEKELLPSHREELPEPA
jgi:integrase/recombinase XerD